MNSVLENQIHEVAASHATDFDPPIYNVRKHQTKLRGLPFYALLNHLNAFDDLRW